MADGALAVLEKLGNEMKAKQAEFTEALKKQSEEMRQHGSTSAETSKLVKTLEAGFLKLQDDHRGELAKANEMIADQKKAYEERMDALELKMQQRVANPPERAKSVGQRLLESENYKSFVGNTSAQTMNPVKLGRIWPERKDLDPGDARDVLSTQLDQQIYAPPRLRQMHLRDVLNVVKTGQAQLRFTVESGYINNADQRNEGAEANLSSISFDTDTVGATQVSHGIVMTKEEARDMPTVENFTENRMVNGIYHKEDRLLVAGTHASLTGFKNVVGAQTYNRYRAAEEGVWSGDTKIDTLRRAQTMLELIELPTLPTVYLVNPEDKEEIDLLKDNEDRYLWVQVMVGGQKVLWQVPIFSTTAMDKGRFTTGDLRQSSTFYDLEDASVQIFNQHSDYALSGKLLLFGDEAVYIAHKIPELIINGSYTGTGSGSGS